MGSVTIPPTKTSFGSALGSDQDSTAKKKEKNIWLETVRKNGINGPEKNTFYISAVSDPRRI